MDKIKQLDAELRSRALANGVTQNEIDKYGRYYNRQNNEHRALRVVLPDYGPLMWTVDPENPTHMLAGKLRKGSTKARLARDRHALTQDQAARLDQAAPQRRTWTVGADRSDDALAIVDMAVELSTPLLRLVLRFIQQEVDRRSRGAKPLDTRPAQAAD